MIAENLIGFDTIPQTIPHYCIESFRRNNKRDALAFKVDDAWQYLSGTEVIEKVRRIAVGLSQLGVRAGDRIAISGYLGSSPAFDTALAEFGETYADVTEGDHGRLAQAAATGRVRAQSDL